VVYIKSIKHTYKENKTKVRASEIALSITDNVLGTMDPKDIDAVICASITKDYIYPSTSCVLAGHIGATNAFSYDIETDFTGFLAALKIGYAFIESKHYKNVLIVSTESFYICDDDDMFADGAVVALLTHEKSDLSIDFIDFEADGSKLKGCYIPMGGAAKPYTKEGVSNKEHYIKIKDHNIFVEAAKNAALYINDKLKEKNLNPDVIIPSYSSIEAHNAFVDSLDIDENKIYSKMKNAKSSISATTGINMSMALEDGFIKKGNKIAVCGYGSGYTKSLALLTYES